jgi:hypothetical protein
MCPLPNIPTALGVILVLAGCVDPPPRVPAVVDLDSMHRLLAVPEWSPEEWDEWCDPPGGIENRCLLTVQIACPPDCGLYADMRRHPRARVIQPTAATRPGFPWWGWSPGVRERRRAIGSRNEQQEE